MLGLSLAMEMGLITPPIGINMFVINALLDNVPMPVSFKGILPFFITDVVRVTIVIAFPVTVFCHVSLAGLRSFDLSVLILMLEMRK